ncbi:RNA polymerase sigma factor [Paraliomyxa miuraensis]|uniref:RNA polymerase sigma factor n=1 Tax=Paraliomyxa miuraensis TaxID=376150 RepID=UPI002251C377|nr:sigma-70 family RNA polymerase sigma factor [Paraliomyxa miuraensis]MCX4245760.1 sigma-70 family RNA polymerase sigma factor [Paraliomyxa miuraensis]
MGGQDDRALLLAWQGGDKRAGGELIDRYLAAILRFFRNKVGNAGEAEELAQRTFEGAVEGALRFRDGASVRTWMFAIARNILRQWAEETARRRGRSEELGDASVADLGAGPSTVMAKRREQRLMLEGLRRLPIESQLVLELCYWEQLTAREIGDVLGCPEGTARSRLRKAKLELRGTLDELARDAAELQSTVHGLETWARELRAAWGA